MEWVKLAVPTLVLCQRDHEPEQMDGYEVQTKKRSRLPTVCQRPHRVDQHNRVQKVSHLRQKHSKKRSEKAERLPPDIGE